MDKILVSDYPEKNRESAILVVAFDTVGVKKLGAKWVGDHCHDVTS